MQFRKIITLVAPLAVALAVVSAPAHAEGGGGPCRHDLQSLCPNVPPGPGSFRDCIESLCPGVVLGQGGGLACLEQHADQLSPACQARLNQMEAKLDAWRQACQGDVEQHCANVAPGQGEVLRCLRQNYASLSQACTDQFARHHRHHERDAGPGQ